MSGNQRGQRSEVEAIIISIQYIVQLTLPTADDLGLAVGIYGTGGGTPWSHARQTILLGHLYAAELHFWNLRLNQRVHEVNRLLQSENEHQSASISVSSRVHHSQLLECCKCLTIQLHMKAARQGSSPGDGQQAF